MMIIIMIMMMVMVIMMVMTVIDMMMIMNLGYFALRRCIKESLLRMTIERHC